MSEQELSKAYDPTEVEGRWYPFWMERGYFTADARSDKPPYCIVLPPPNVTGSLHLGHAVMVALQDILIRWKRMSGFNCLWLPGTDHAGIATQMVVEKELKKTEKKSRHDLGREEFLKRVWTWKEKYGSRIIEQMQVLGGSLDWSRHRFTMDEGVSRSVREVFVQLYEQKLLYRAQKLINWCPSCHTALSDLEVEHEEKDGSLWHIAYPVQGDERKLVVATTRPETMLGDTAVAIHPDDERYKGLAGKRAILPLVGREIPIIDDAELVNPEFGTGVVKVTPAHDFNDYQTGLRHQLPMISIFDDNARMNEKVPAEYVGLERYEARKKVLADLTERGFLVKEEPHKLSIGQCQRCGTVVEPRLSPQWFVKIEPLAKKAIEAVEKGETKLVPETWTATYFNWMRNIHDWCVSRQLWWGHQIPAWYCKACSPKKADGGIDYAAAEPMVARQAPTSCGKCGSAELTQDPDVLDTWFSSGLWPFSTLGWPEQTEDLKTFYPNTVMETGHDILFFWVARMMMFGLHFMGKAPFKTVYLHAMVRDEKGEKMSKVKGNVIDPLDVIRGAPPEQLLPSLRNKFPGGMPAFGADALRFTLAAMTQQGRDIKLSLERVAGYKAFTNKLWNASRFALMNLGDFRPDGRFVKDRSLSLADRWILARLHRAIGGTLEALRQFGFAEGANILYQFLWYELCDWYIELAKGALYGKDEVAKESTRAVLVYVLDQVTRLLHPYMPFITEEIWQKLPMERDVESIMVASFPDLDSRLQDPAAEAEMAPVIAAIEGLRNIRGESDLAPSAKLEAHVQSADPLIRKTLQTHAGYVVPLAGLSSLKVGAPGPKPAQAAAFVGPQLEIYVPLAGLVDFAEERARLTKELARVEQDLGGLNRKLENPNFVAKAPPDVVVKDRARVEELTARKAKLKENLNRIAPETAMPDPKSPNGSSNGHPPGGDPEVASIVTNPETAKVKVAEDAGDGGVDLGQELKGDLENVPAPKDVDPQVKTALEKLREGTKEGLSASDHYDLGVAYMGMGLVDDAVREFNEAKKPEKKGAKLVAKAKAIVAKAKAVAVAVKASAQKKPAKAAKKPAKKPAKAKAKAKAKAPAKKAKPVKKPAARKAKPKARAKSRK